MIQTVDGSEFNERLRILPRRRIGEFRREMSGENRRKRMITFSDQKEACENPSAREPAALHANSRFLARLVASGTVLRRKTRPSRQYVPTIQIKMCTGARAHTNDFVIALR